MAFRASSSFRAASVESAEPSLARRGWRSLLPSSASARFGVVIAALGALSAVASASGCSSKITEVAPGSQVGAPVDGGSSDAASEPAVDAATDAAASNPALAGCIQDPGAPAVTVDASSKTDPAGSAEQFTLAKALAGFPEGAGKLTAVIETEKSTIKCELFEDVAPISVANFVGLARGTRPYKDGAKWKVGRFYDGLTWHRVIPGFVIQGGDPDGNGTGGPGYDLVNENHVEETLGTLAMAASKTPSGSQFYIVVGKGPAADYNVFGNCTTEAAIEIAKVSRDEDDKPVTPVHMIKVDIGRCP